MVDFICINFARKLRHTLWMYHGRSQGRQRAGLHCAGRRAEQRAVGPGETFGCLRDRGLGDFMVNSGLSGGFNGGLMAQQWLNIGESWDDNGIYPLVNV